MVAFGFLPQNFGRCRGPTNGTLSFSECRFSGGDTMRRWVCPNSAFTKEFVETFSTHRWWGRKNFERKHSHLSHLVKLSPFLFKFVKGILNVILVLSFGDLSVDGRVCFCTTDLCAAGGCGDGKVGILGYWLVLSTS